VLDRANTTPVSAASLEAFIVSLPAVGLSECGETGERRFDRKFVVPVSALDQLAQALDSAGRDWQSWQVLEVEGQRTVEYHTVYFDAPELQLYRDHLQGRRRRFKIRTRRYSTGSHMLEIKLKGIRGQTEKLRRERGTDARYDQLDADEIGWLGDALQAALAKPAPQGLAASAQTRYSRTCLVGPDGERLTIDRDFAVAPAGRAASAAADLVCPDMAIVECKSPRLASNTERLLRGIARRPDRLSKYAVALALTQDVHSNPWYPALRRLNVLPLVNERFNRFAHD
jgi:hypothetical protein